MQWLSDALREMWNELVLGFLAKWFNAFFNFLAWIVNAIATILWTIVDFCLGMAWDFCFFLYDLFLGEEGFVWYVVEQFIEFGIWIVEWLLLAFPDIAAIVTQYEGTFSFAMRWIGMLDAFFPVTESLTLFGIYMGFMFVVLSVRLILKIVPGMGG